MHIGDIAEMAGVSKAAVSRFLNNGYVSAEKRERIRKVIEATGFKPSAMARNLRTKRTGLVGVILPRIHSDSISGIAAGIGTVLNSSGHEMLLAVTDNSSARELDFLRIFKNDKVDGIILVATVFTEEHRRLIEELPVPCVAVGQDIEGMTCVFHGDLEAGLMMGEHVAGTGVRAPAYIGVTPDDRAVGVVRRQGVMEALEAAGTPVTDERIRICDFSSEAGEEAASDLLDGDGDIDAIICATDAIALGAMRAAIARGLNIPGDIEIAGFGDSVISSATTPQISTVRYQYTRSGGLAASILLEKMSDNREHESVMLSCELVERGSTRKGE